MHMQVVVELFKYGQIVVPELNGCVKHKPRLLGLGAKLDGFCYVVSELGFVLAKRLFLLISELSIVLIIFKGYQLFVTYFNI
jgi:hypothetical protein